MIRPPKSQTACHHGSVQPCCPFSTPPSQPTDGSPTTLGTLCPSSGGNQVQNDVPFCRSGRLYPGGNGIGHGHSDLPFTSDHLQFAQPADARRSVCPHSENPLAPIPRHVPWPTARQFVYGAERDGPLQIGSCQDEQQQQYVKQNAGQRLFTFQRRGALHGRREGVSTQSVRIDFDASNIYATDLICHQEWLEFGLVEIEPVYVSSSRNLRTSVFRLLTIFPWSISISNHLGQLSTRLSSRPATPTCTWEKPNAPIGPNRLQSSPQRFAKQEDPDCDSL